MLIYVYKLIFVLVFAFIGYEHPPFQVSSKFVGAALGAGFALALVLLTVRIKKPKLRIYGVLPSVF